MRTISFDVRSNDWLQSYFVAIYSAPVYARMCVHVQIFYVWGKHFMGFHVNYMRFLGLFSDEVTRRLSTREKPASNPSNIILQRFFVLQSL
jgi:hypothetical protein